MPDRNLPDPGGPLRRVSPTVVVITFALVMTACVLGVVVWKALDAKRTTLARGQTDIQNLAHSLAEHAAHTIQSADIAMAGMVDLLKYRDPMPERFNRYLAETVEHAAADTRDRRARCRGQLAVFVVAGNTRCTTMLRPALLHLSSRNAGKRAPHQRAPAIAPDRTIPTIILSKRITSRTAASPASLTAAIDSDYFNRFYRTFQLGPDGSISLMRNDGVVLIRWPASDKSTDLSGHRPVFKAS